LPDWSSASGGALRTGAIGSLALRNMAPTTARTLGVIGTGRQAETQVMAVRSSLTHIDVFGRNAANRTAFAARLEQRFEEVVICATTSEQPGQRPVCTREVRREVER
jgi:ornithine cyclodeaminase/alanine dehydrogenase-like protein (mu-crystallin family)